MELVQSIKKLMECIIVGTTFLSNATKFKIYKLLFILIVDDIFNYISFNYVTQVANNINHKQQPFMDGKKNQQIS
jgi:hypothetical protein